MEKKAIVVLIAIVVVFWLTKSPVYVDKETDIHLKYKIEYPADADKDSSLPLIIALHGNGDTVDNFYQYTFKDFPLPARVVLIEAPDKYWPNDIFELKRYSTAIAHFSDEMNQSYTSENRPVLFGYSGGGVMAYFSALTHCDSYSVVMPVSGMLRKDLIPDDADISSQCNVVAFHGNKDNVVSYSSGQFAADEIRKHSPKIRFTTFEGGHHGIFQEAKKQIFDELRFLIVAD